MGNILIDNQSHKMVFVSVDGNVSTVRAGCDIEVKNSPDIKVWEVGKAKFEPYISGKSEAIIDDLTFSASSVRIAITDTNLDGMIGIVGNTMLIVGKTAAINVLEIMMG